MKTTTFTFINGQMNSWLRGSQQSICILDSIDMGQFVVGKSFSHMRNRLIPRIHKS